MNQESPKLAAPGAGIPLLERFFAGVVLRKTVLYRTDWNGLLDLFEKETARIAKLVQPLPSGTLHGRVLIERLRGLEDSSRYWSPAMVLEHLMITVPGMGGIVETLLDARRPDLVVDTAKVKPQGADESLDAEEMTARFLFVCGETRSALVDRGPGTDSRYTHRHPWFGEFRAVDWTWLLYAHHRVHREQLEAILARGREART